MLKKETEEKETEEKCPFCEEICDNWSDKFEGVVHHKNFVPNYEKNGRLFHEGTHIYETNGNAILDVESFQYLIHFCPFCGRKLTKN